jgi:hypothetical protein
MRGEREYAFTVVGFDADGDNRFLTRTLTAFGYRRDQLRADLRRRLLAWGIMHRHSNFTWRMRRLPERRRAMHTGGLPGLFGHPELPRLTVPLGHVRPGRLAAGELAFCAFIGSGECHADVFARALPILVPQAPRPSCTAA